MENFTEEDLAELNFDFVELDLFEESLWDSEIELILDPDADEVWECKAAIESEKDLVDCFRRKTCKDCPHWK